MNCPTCGVPLEPTARFCGNCATPNPAFGRGTAAPATCAGCGSGLELQERFCGVCGTPRGATGGAPPRGGQFVGGPPIGGPPLGGPPPRVRERSASPLVGVGIGAVVLLLGLGAVLIRQGTASGPIGSLLGGSSTTPTVAPSAIAGGAVANTPGESPSSPSVPTALPLGSVASVGAATASPPDERPTPPPGAISAGSGEVVDMAAPDPIWAVYQRDADGYALALPADWFVFDLDRERLDDGLTRLRDGSTRTLDQWDQQACAMADEGHGFFGIDVALDSSGDGWTTGFYVVKTSMAAPTSLDALSALYLDQLSKSPEVVQPLSQRRVRLQAGEAVEIRYRLSGAAPFGASAVRQYLLVRGADAISLYLVTDPSLMDARASRFEQIAQGFRFGAADGVAVGLDPSPTVDPGISNGSTPTVNQTDPGQLFANPAEGYAILLPMSWLAVVQPGESAGATSEHQVNQQMASMMMAFYSTVRSGTTLLAFDLAPEALASASETPVPTSISISRSVDPNQTPLDAVARGALGELQASPMVRQPIAQRTLRLGDADAVELRYSQDLSARLSGAVVDGAITRYLIVRGENQYWIEFTTAPELANQYAPRFEQIAQTFDLLN